jgi:carboxypeptidase family protein
LEDIMLQRFAQVALCALAFTTLAKVAPAQKAPKSLPVMRGAVTDTGGRPLEGAQVEILGLTRTATTPGSGSYRFEGIKPGKYWVVARRIGYAPRRTALSFNPGDDREIRFQLEPLPYNLPDVKVRAEDKAWMRKYQDFVWRSKASFHGYFLTRDDLDRAQGTYLGDVVRRYLPFTNSQSYFTPYFADPFADRLGQFGASTRSRFMSGCAPAVSVNGGRPMGGWAVNDFRPEDVEAVEVYRGGYQLPLEFTGWEAPCGLVIVWTR